MSLHFILDGYNIVKQAFFPQAGNLKSARDRLLSLIETHSPQGSSKNSVTVVFDGKEDLCYCEPLQFKKVIFSKGQDADSCIRSMVEKSAHPKAIVVVTDDKELKFSVRRSGAKIMSVAEFLTKARIKKPKVLENSKDLSFYLSEQITSEFKKIWLKALP